MHLVASPIEDDAVVALAGFASGNLEALEGYDLERIATAAILLLARYGCYLYSDIERPLGEVADDFAQQMVADLNITHAEARFWLLYALCDAEPSIRQELDERINFGAVFAVFCWMSQLLATSLDVTTGEFVREVGSPTWRSPERL